MKIVLALIVLVLTGCQHGIYPQQATKCVPVVMGNGVTQVVCL